MMDDGWWMVDGGWWFPGCVFQTEKKTPMKGLSYFSHYK